MDTDVVVVDDKEQQAQQNNSDMQEVVEVIDLEDGELNENNKNKLKFEIIFEDQSECKNLKQHILNILNENLFKACGRKFEFNESTNKISAYEEIEAAKETVKKTDNEVEVIHCSENSNDSIDFGESLNNLFRIDAEPSEKLESCKVPSYKRMNKNVCVLDDEIKPKKAKKDEDSCPRPKPTSACFNCGALDHGIRDCQMPRNFQRIANAKKKLASKGERYHVDVDQRFAHLRAGVISDRLRKALGLRSKELPSFYHRMRVFGYPPGWLEDAKVSHSGLAMFNTGDEALKCDDNSSGSESEVKYDISKIIEFPGFNTMPEGYRDDFYLHNVPKFDPQFSKESMIAALGDNAIKGFKRKKIKDHNAETTSTITKPNEIIDLSSQEMDNADMEIEDIETATTENIEFTRPMPPSLPPSEEDNNLPPPPPEETSTLPTDESTVANTEKNPKSTAETEEPKISSPKLKSPQTKERSRSPTLEELQAKQRDLLLILENSDLKNEENSSTTLKTPATPETPSTPAPVTPSTNEDSSKKIQFSHIGTPVLKFTPFEKLPAGENFKVGVSDVINFENLPDSTGKYEAMKLVIGKVRSIKKRLDQEDD